MNFDGGFGVVPGSESHAGQVRHVCNVTCGILVLCRYTAVLVRLQSVVS